MRNRTARIGAVADEPCAADLDDSASDNLDVLARRLVSDLHTPMPAIFWADLASTAVIGWTAFAATLAQPLSPLGLGAFVVAALALYRGAVFTHELSHLRRQALPGFETVWNLVFGVPLLLPSFTYVGVHQSHHNLASYGTKADPEYLPFASSRRLMIAFGVQSALLLPILLVFRFFVLAPIGLAWPRFHRWLETHASSFSMNPEYRRDVSPQTAVSMRRWEAVALVLWASAAALFAGGMLPASFPFVWMAVVMAISLLNTLRVLGAHEYVSDGQPRSRLEQLRDSIDTPGGPWTELWAPVGLRYHALHHYFPGIPYHNLGAAYRRLIEGLPITSLYRGSTSPSLRASLSKLYASAKRSRSA